MENDRPTTEPAYTDCMGKPVTEGTHLHCWQRGFLTTGINSCFLWQVERGKTGKLLLVAQGIKKRLPLTQGRLMELTTYQPAEELKLSDYPEEWGWWRACGWGVLLGKVWEPVLDKPVRWGVDFQAHRHDKLPVGFTLMEDEPLLGLLVGHPERMRRLLGEALYYQVHPRKKRQQGQFGVEKLSEADYTAFAEEMRRKVAKLGQP